MRRARRRGPRPGRPRRQGRHAQARASREPSSRARRLHRRAHGLQRPRRRVRPPDRRPRRAVRRRPRPHQRDRELLEPAQARPHGTYVSVEPFHLFRYLDERVFTYNERDLERLRTVRGRPGPVAGRRLTYAEVTGRTEGVGWTGYAVAGAAVPTVPGPASASGLGCVSGSGTVRTHRRRS